MAIPDVGWRGNGNDGTGTGLVAATDLVPGPYGDSAIEFNGADELVNCGDCGTIRVLEFMVRPATTTEEIVQLSAGNDIMVNAGTITYTGVAASATYVDGVASTTLVANVWQHVVCVLSADHAADDLEWASDGTNFGAIQLAWARIYSATLTNIQVRDLYERTRRGIQV